MGIITAVVDVGEEITLWRSLRRLSTAELFNRGLDELVIEDKKQWIKRYIGRWGGGGGLS